MAILKKDGDHLVDYTDILDDENVAPIEENISTRDYAIGDLLILGGYLYKAKTAIAVGDVLLLNVNIVPTTVSDEIKNSAQVLAPLEGATTSRDYDEGDLLVYNGVLYKTVVALPTGTILRPNINITPTTMSAELGSATEVLDFNPSGTTLRQDITIGEFCTMLAQRFYPVTSWIYNNGAVSGINFAGSNWNNAGSYLYLTGLDAVCYTAAAIDVTNYTTIHFRGKVGTTENSGGSYYCGVAKVATGSYAASRAHSTTNYQQYAIADDIDVSELTGTYYVQFSGKSARRPPEGYDCYAEMRQIWLD